MSVEVGVKKCSKQPKRTTSEGVGERRRAWKSWAGEVEAEEARTQSTTAGTASAGRARKQLLRAATACSEGDAMAEAEADGGARGERGQLKPYTRVYYYKIINFLVFSSEKINFLNFFRITQYNDQHTHTHFYEYTHANHIPMSTSK